MSQPLNILKLDKFDPTAFDIPIDYQITDFRDIGGRKGTKSKTVAVPGTKKNNTLLGFYFDPKNEGFFDPNKRAPAVIDNGTLRIFEGNMILRRVEKENNVNSKYEFNLVGENSSWFDTIKDKTLRDLDLPTITFNTSTVVASWFDNGDTGKFTFPLIDYGTLGSFDSTSDLPFEILKPAVFKKPMLLQIFRDAGFTVVSDFFKIPEMRDLLMPHTTGKISPSQEFLDAQAATTININQNITTTPTVMFKLPTAIEISDPSNNFFINSGNYQCPGNGTYTVNVLINFRVNLNPIGGTITIRIDNQGTALLIQDVNVPAGFQNVTNRVELSVDNVALNKDDTIKVIISKSGAPFTADVFATFLGEFTQMDVTVDSLEYTEGQEIDLKKTVPDMKQSDFIKGLANQFNLWFITDSISKTVRIEPRDNLLKDINEAEDWTEKLDISKKVTHEQITEGLNRTLKFQYKKDSKDAEQAEWFNIYGLELGDRDVLLENEALEGDKSLQLPFSATRMIRRLFGEVHVPVMRESLDLFKEDGTTLVDETFDFEPRSLIYGGLREGQWKWDGSSRLVYPYAYFEKDTSTIQDINLHFNNLTGFKNTGSSIYQGLVDRHYKKQIRQLNKGRLSKFFLRLTDLDISNLNYTTPKLIDKTYYYLNKIKNYLPGTKESTETETLTV